MSKTNIKSKSSTSSTPSTRSTSNKVVVKSTGKSPVISTSKSTTKSPVNSTVKSTSKSPVKATVKSTSKSPVKAPVMKAKSSKSAKPSRITIPVVQLNGKGKKLKTFKSICEASEKTGVNVGTISKVVRGMGKTAGGFGWVEKI